MLGFLSEPLSLNTELNPGDRVFLRFNASFAGQPIATALNRLVSHFESVRVGHFELEGYPVYDPAGQTVNVIVRVTGTPLHLIVAAIIAIAGAVALILIFREARLIVTALPTAVQTVVTERTRQQLLAQCAQLEAEGRYAEAAACRQQAGTPGSSDFGQWLQENWLTLALVLGGIVILPRVFDAITGR